jgi:hypothetical protein
MINDDVRASTQDIVAMDGVIHAIDTLLLPPMPSEDDDKPQTETTSWIASLLQLLYGKTAPETLTVESIIERLNPLLEPGT